MCGCVRVVSVSASVWGVSMFVRAQLCLSVYQSVCVSVFVFLSVCLSACQPVCLLSVYLCVSLSVPYVRPYVCLFLFMLRSLANTHVCVLLLVR